MKCSVHPEARRELLEAIDYYNGIEPGLGASFLAEIESAVSLVEEFPPFGWRLETASAVVSSAVFPTRCFTPSRPGVCPFLPSCTLAANPDIGLPDGNNKGTMGERRWRKMEGTDPAQNRRSPLRREPRVASRIPGGRGSVRAAAAVKRGRDGRGARSAGGREGRRQRRCFHARGG